jgi:glutamyl-Q tRNA(Asp) synthetase
MTLVQRPAGGEGQRPYRGRFAPSPTGPLHAGSMVAALASWLDARAHHGQWLVRIEDVDAPRCLPGADTLILQQLAICGMVSDEPPWWQSKRGTAYQDALENLQGRGLTYPCSCTRKSIEIAWRSRGVVRERHAELVYPGTCRPPSGLVTDQARQGPVAWRFDTLEVEHLQGSSTTRWTDRRKGPQSQIVSSEVGDFVLRRSDGWWSYQLAVVVDDADQGITHVVRGEDLLDNTARQQLLQLALGLHSPTYLHTPLVLGPHGEKLSKQTGAEALDLRDPLSALNAAAQVLGLPLQKGTLEQALSQWTGQWASRYLPPR